MINIDKEFKSLIPSLTSEEYKQLEQNIINEGCRDALVTWNDTIIDGHNRYEICTKNNIPFETVTRKFENREEVIEWIIKNQFGRRNLRKSVRVKLALKLKKVISDIAKKKQLSNLKHQPVVQTKWSKREEPIITRKELAKIADVGEGTIYRMEVIEREASSEQKEALENGTKEIGTVFHELGHGLSKKKVIEETKICSVCNVHKPIREFSRGMSTCNTCRNFISKSSEDSKTVRAKLKQFADVDVEAMYEEMKKPSIKVEKVTEVKNECIVAFNDLLNEFDTDINQYTHMNFIFKDDSSSKQLIEKQIANLNKIIKMMEE